MVSKESTLHNYSLYRNVSFVYDVHDLKLIHFCFTRQDIQLCFETLEYATYL